MSGWNPNSDLGEDGLPNVDKANYPFWVINLGDYLAHRSTGCATSSTDTKPDCNERKIVMGPAKGKYLMDIWRFNPPYGYVALGDYIACFPSDDQNDDEAWPNPKNNRSTYSMTKQAYQSKLMLVFVKEKSGNSQNPYAKKCTTAERVKSLLEPDNYRGSDLNNTTVSEYNWSKARTDEWRWCNFGAHHSKYGKQQYNYIEGSDGNYNAYIYMYNPNDEDGGNYVALGLTFQVQSAIKWIDGKWQGVDPEKNIVTNQLENVWAVNKDLLINMRGSNINKLSSSLTTPYYVNKQGRLLGESNSAGSGCNFKFLSTSMIYNRKGKSSTERSTSYEFLSTADGAVVMHNGWNLSGEQWDKFIYNLKLYMLVPLSAKKVCCTTDLVAGESECGWGSFILSYDKPQCIDFARDLCQADNESDLTGDLCLTKMCKNGPDSQNPLICDREYSKFCQIKDSSGNYINYKNYPDVCACFMPQDFLTFACNDMKTSLGLQNNKAALKALNIDTSDPDQCNQNCSVNPLCRLYGSVPSTDQYPVERHNKLIQKGGLVDKTKCGDRTICIQSAVVNNQGKVGSLKINQDASCSSITDKVCGKSKFSLCNTKNNIGLFTKVLQQDNDNGSCGNPGENVQCANFNLTPIYDNCVNGKRIQVYKQLPIKLNPGVVKGGVSFEKTLEDIDEDDALDALRILISPSLKNAYPSFCKPCRLGMIVSDCQDCVMGFESSGNCFLDGNVWKQKFTKTKILQAPNNGGKACITSNETINDNCSQNKDCKVTLLENDQGCIDGSRTMKYTITELNSGNGMSCEQAVLNVLPKTYKDNLPSISISSDYKTAKASIGCQDCVVGYTLDNNFNNGKCYWNGSSWVVKKIPVFLKEVDSGGTCSQDKIDLVKRNQPIYEKCKVDQDCSINSTPIKDECNDVTGERTIIFSIDKLQNGNGLNCLDVGKLMAKKYDISEKNVSYNDSKKQLTFKGNCLLSKNCVLSENPIDSISDLKQGLTVDLYNIINPVVNRGKTCDEVLKSKVNYETFSVEEDGQLYVYRKGELENNRSFYIFAGIALLVVIILIVIILIRK